MTRPLRKTPQPALLLPLEEVLHLLGISANKWRELLAAEHLASQSGRTVKHPLPRPVELAGRPMYRRRDVEAWVESLELRNE